MEKTFLTESIYIREMHEKDAIDIHAYASIAEVSKYQPWGPNSLEDTNTYLNAALNDALKKPRTRFVFAMADETKEKMIGSGEICISDTVNRCGEIGYILHPEYWGKGYATKIGENLLQFGFSELDLHRIFATCDMRNIASSRVLEKIGMVKEGILRENILLRDGWRNTFLYSILRHEWDIRSL